MKKIALILSLLAFSLQAFAQTSKSKTEKAVTSATPAKTPLIKTNSTPIELARAAVTAHGGDKFKQAKSIKQIGSADVTLPNSTQSLTVSYLVIMAGEKFRFEINSPFANFQQIYDGENLYSSIGSSDIPPLSKLGMSLLTKIDEKGYKVEALPNKKKWRGFRIATPDGYATDFYIDSTTAQVMNYEAKFNVKGREVSTAVEHDKFKEVDGIVVPEKFSQRFDLSGNTFYASFKAKEILVNTAIADSVFVIPQQ